MSSPSWWTPPWRIGTDADPDAGWHRTPPPAASELGGPAWTPSAHGERRDDDAILNPLEAQLGQVRSRDRVRSLAEVFTHQREIDAMLDQMPDAFSNLDLKFLEPSCGSGNFLTEMLRRKLRLVIKAECVSQDQYEHRLLRAAASIYGIDISPENVTEARGRMAHVILEHYQTDANTIEPTAGFLNAAALVLGDNVCVGDSLNAAAQVELCDWHPHAGGRFQRVLSFALVPPAKRDLFWSERIHDLEPVHYSELQPRPAPVRSRRGKKAAT